MQINNKPSYYLVSLSNKENLDLCIKYNLAGFTNSINGVWTYLEINKGDYISFLYGAKVYNLYQVLKKVALKNAENLPPWPQIRFKESGKMYYFPFRLYLKPIRKLEESLVRVEFAYVAENLLLRGGYRKTHFQADQTTLQNVSQMGNVWNENLNNLSNKQFRNNIFEPKFTRVRTQVKIPEIFYFQEIILQTLVKYYLINNLNKFFEELFLLKSPILNELDELEILSEKALPEGHIDLLIKEAVPIGQARKIVIEVKNQKAKMQHLEQLDYYLNEFKDECICGILIASDFSKKIIKAVQNKNIKLVKWSININLTSPYSFNEILKNFKLEVLQ